jgi:hypothetical protein
VLQPYTQISHLIECSDAAAVKLFIAYSAKMAIRQGLISHETNTSQRNEYKFKTNTSHHLIFICLKWAFQVWASLFWLLLQTISGVHGDRRVVGRSYTSESERSGQHLRMGASAQPNTNRLHCVRKLGLKCWCDIWAVGWLYLVGEKQSVLWKVCADKDNRQSDEQVERMEKQRRW